MGANVNVQIVGDKKLLKELEKLGDDVKKVKKQALEAGAKVVKDAANPKAPGPNIVIGKSRSRGGLGERAGEDAIFIGPDDEHWYYRFLEFGAAAHSIGKKGQILTLFGEEFITAATQHPGFPAKPFLRPAMDENESQTRDAVGNVLRDAIERGRSG